MPLLSFAARLRACRDYNQSCPLPPIPVCQGQPTLSTTTFSINPLAFSGLVSAPPELFFILPFGLGLVLREWFALLLPPPLKDFRRLGSDMRTMVDIDCGELWALAACC